MEPNFSILLYGATIGLGYDGLKNLYRGFSKTKTKTKQFGSVDTLTGIVEIAVIALVFLI